MHKNKNKLTTTTATTVTANNNRSCRDILVSVDQSASIHIILLQHRRQVEDCGKVPNDTLSGFKHSRSNCFCLNQTLSVKTAQYIGSGQRF